MWIRATFELWWTRTGKGKERYAFVARYSFGDHQQMILLLLFICYFQSQLLLYFPIILKFSDSTDVTFSLEIRIWDMGCLQIVCVCHARDPKRRAEKSKRGNEAAFLMELWVIATWFPQAPLRWLGICAACFPQLFTWEA